MFSRPEGFSVDTTFVSFACSLAVYRVIDCSSCKQCPWCIVTTGFKVRTFSIDESSLFLCLVNLIGMLLINLVGPPHSRPGDPKVPPGTFIERWVFQFKSFVCLTLVGLALQTQAFIFGVNASSPLRW